MSRKLTTEEFIERAKKIHGDKYDYSEVNYINAKIKVEIICKIHGHFFKNPFDHLSGQGCPLCGELRRIIRVRAVIERRKSSASNS